MVRSGPISNLKRVGLNEPSKLWKCGWNAEGASALDPWLLSALSERCVHGPEERGQNTPWE